MNLYCFSDGQRRYEVVASDLMSAWGYFNMPHTSRPACVKTIPCDILDPGRIVMDWLVNELGLWGARETSFVQIGGGDGVTGDPLYLYVKKFGWWGVVVEPLPWLFDKLVTNYAEMPQVKLVNCAIVNEDRAGMDVPMWYVCPSKQEDRWLEQVGSLSEVQVVTAMIRHGGMLASDKQSTWVGAMQFKDLIAQHPDLAPLDILCIDTEGYDYEVLKQVKWDEDGPRLVIYEEKNLSDGDKRAARQLLVDHDYVLVPCGADVYAARGLEVEREIVGHPL